MIRSATSTYIVLCGKTGSGKTALLEELERLGYPVIHLEKIASHRGSAFGDMMLSQQPSQKEFEEQLKNLVSVYDSAPYVFLEQKSSSIGKRKIPGWFLLKMVEGISVELEVSEEVRIQNILKVYSNGGKQQFFSGLQKLTNRLPPSAIEQSQALLHAENYGEFIKLMLCYYDQTKGYNNYRKPGITISSTHNNFLTLAKQTLQALRRIGITIS